MKNVKHIMDVPLLGVPKDMTRLRLVQDNIQTPTVQRTSSNSSNRVEQMKKVQREGLELFTRKNKDYGDAFAEYGVVGVLMRIEDKIKRMMSISKTSVVLVNEETLRDTLIDLHNYSAMGIMLMDEKTE
jgi:hypothetical protein